MEEAHKFLSDYFFVFFLLMWLGVSGIISFIGGWFSLARLYRCSEKINVDMFYMKSGTMRMMTNYNGCLNIGVNKEGLRLSVLPFFRFAHPPLFIPWKDISFSTSRSLFMKTATFTFQNGVPLRISYRLAKKIFSKNPDIFNQ